MENKMDITPDKLMSDGWVKTDDWLFIYEKAIPNRNPINNTPKEQIWYVILIINIID